MVLHVGINPYNGQMSSYDTLTAAIKTYSICNIKHSYYYQVDIDEYNLAISKLFNDVKSKLGTTLGNACICINNVYSNEIRKLFIKYGKQCGFQIIETINIFIAHYLHVISQFPNYKIQDDENFWIFTEHLDINIWQKCYPKVKHIVTFGSLDAAISAQSEFGKDSRAIFYASGSTLDISNLKTLYPKCQFFAYLEVGNSFDFIHKMALMKAQITAKCHKQLEFNPQNIFFQSLIVATENEEIINITVEENSVHYKKDSFDPTKTYYLPFVKSVKMKKKCKVVSVYREHETANFVLPDFHEFLLIFIIDNNGIYSLKCIDIPCTANDNGRISNHSDDIEARTEALILVRLTIKDTLTNTVYNFPEKFTTNNENINAVGVDLGTSRCCVVVNRRNGMEPVQPDNNEKRVLPSYVSFDEKHVKCGQPVIDRLQYKAKSTIFDSKRLIGKSFLNIQIDDNWPFKIQVTNISELENAKMAKSEPELIHVNSFMLKVEGCDGDILLHPEDVSAALLKHLKLKAEEFQGKALDEVVITRENQRTKLLERPDSKEQQEATYVAGILAGWKKIHLLPEPVAATFKYFLDRPIANNSTLLLFDLGGGTLDVCIFRIENDQLKIISRSGDPNLGGRDFDNILVEYFKRKLADINFVVSENKKYKLLSKCQDIKEYLSVSESDCFHVSDFDPSNETSISITRAEFENLSINLLNQIKANILKVIESPQEATKIDKVFQVGGGCRMPMIKKMLQEIFPNAEHGCQEHPEEVVAVGAAYYAYYLNNKPTVEVKEEKRLLSTFTDLFTLSKSLIS